MKATSETWWNRKHRSVESVRRTISRLLPYSSLQTIPNGSPAKRCLSQVVCVNNSRNKNLTKREIHHAIHNCWKRKRSQHRHLLQRLGQGSAHSVQPWLAAVGR